MTHQKLSQYFYSPAGFDSKIYLVSHQSLFVWDGALRRLCSFKHNIKDLKLSADGTKISFFSREYSNGDIYVYNLDEASDKIVRMTYFNDPVIVNIGWEDSKVLFSSSSKSTFRHDSNIYSVDENKLVTKIIGGAGYIAKSPTKSIVQINGYAYHKWRNYCGGSAAKIGTADGNMFKPLPNLPLQNCYNPIFIGERLFFLTDACDSRTANIFEYIFDEDSIIQRTFHEDFAIFDLAKYESNLIYSCGGKIYIYECEVGKSKHVDIHGNDYSKSASEFYVGLKEYYNDIDVSNKGDRVAICSRGRIFSYDVMQQITIQHALDLRYRIGCFMSDNSLIYVKDEGDSCIIKHCAFDKGTPYNNIKLNLGSFKEIKPFGANKILAANHKGELYMIDLQTGGHEFIAKSRVNTFYGIDHSPNLQWIVFSAVVSETETMAKIMLYNAQTKDTVQVSHGLESDFSPVFTPDGKYIYFLSFRQNNPRYDNLVFNLYFNSKADVYAICVNSEVPHPFKPSEVEKEEKKDEEIKYPDIVPNEFTVIKSDIPSDYYLSIVPLSGKKTLLMSKNENGTRKKDKNLQIKCYDSSTGETTTISSNVSHVSVSENRQWMTCIIGDRVRIGAAGEKFNDDDKSWKKGGWCNIDGFEYFIQPREEWQDILKHSWWLIKEKFWNPEELKDWDKVLEKYLKLVDAIKSREDLNLLLEQMNGETYTSHAYLIDRGDNDIPNYDSLGNLGAEVNWNTDGYEIQEIHEYYNRENILVSPLLQQGTKVAKGDKIIAVNGVKCTQDLPLAHHLQYKQKVNLSIMTGTKVRNVTVDLIPNEQEVKYHTWVRKNREYVHKVTNKKVGYIHIPDMSPFGFREFYRAYVTESLKDGLVIDVRYNGGGHVSSLILNTLKNKWLGLYKSKHDVRFPIPDNSNSGNMVALCNYGAGSDGDIFTYEFKVHKLGLTIGTRTWGGIVGISPNDCFIDQGKTSQPEYACIYKVEDYTEIEGFGVEPDLQVQNPMECLRCEDDIQLNRGIQEVLDKMPSA